MARNHLDAVGDDNQCTNDKKISNEHNTLRIIYCQHGSPNEKKNCFDLIYVGTKNVEKNMILFVQKYKNVHQKAN